MDKEASNEILSLYFADFECYGDNELIVSQNLRRQNILNQKGELIEGRGAFCLCTGGNATFTMLGKELHVKKDDVLIAYPGSVMSLLDASTDFDLKLVVISHEFIKNSVFKKALSLNDIFSFISGQPVLHLPLSEVPFFLKSWDLLRHIILSVPNEFTLSILYSQISTLMMWLNAMITNHMQTDPVVLRRGDELVAQFLRLVSQHFREEHRLNFYADKLCVSTKYLSSVTRNVTHNSAGRFITYFIITEAKKLLIESQYSVSQIGYRLGFPTQSAFGKYFKKEIGLSPSQFRESR